MSSVCYQWFWFYYQWNFFSFHFYEEYSIQIDKPYVNLRQVNHLPLVIYIRDIIF